MPPFHATRPVPSKPRFASSSPQFSSRGRPLSSRLPRPRGRFLPLRLLPRGRFLPLRLLPRGRFLSRLVVLCGLARRCARTFPPCGKRLILFGRCRACRQGKTSRWFCARPWLPRARFHARLTPSWSECGPLLWPRAGFLALRRTRWAGRCQRPRPARFHAKRTTRARGFVPLLSLRAGLSQTKTALCAAPRRSAVSRPGSPVPQPLVRRVRPGRP